VTPPAPPSERRALYGLLVLSAINLFNYLDRYLVAGVLPRIEREFGLDHDQAGLLGTVFVVVYMLASPLGGFLGDRVPRRFLVAGGVLLWSLATVGSGLATTFGALLLARAFIGVGEAGYGTVAPAVISDLFPRARRTRMLSFFYVAIPVGAAAGYAIGGWVSATWSWQAAFFVGGIPGLFFAALALAMPEPRRGATEEGPTPEKIPFGVGLRALSRNTVFWFNTAGLTLMTFSIGGLAYWMPSFLELERGMDPAFAGFTFGAITASAGLLGTLTGGYLGDWAERRRAGGGMWVSGIGLVLAGPFMLLAANLPTAPLIFAAVFGAQFMLFLNSGPINAAICNCVQPAFRAFAMGVNVLMIHLLGDAISPPLIGWVGRHHSLAVAIEVNAAPVLLGGLVLLWGARTLAGLTSVTARPGQSA
jgi:MFS transporter, Spinster family, sphingosine-1-phosphate transporter